MVSKMPLQTPVYGPGYVSRGTSSPRVEFIGFRDWKKFMLWEFVAPAVVSPEVQICCVFAVFFNESINRDIITGRYLKRPLVI